MMILAFIRVTGGFPGKIRGDRMTKCWARSEKFFGAFKIVHDEHRTTVVLASGWTADSVFKSFSMVLSGGVGGWDWHKASFNQLLEQNIIMSDHASHPVCESKADSLSPPINVWVVDDNKNIRSSLMELLALTDELRCTATFPSPNAVLSALASKPGPDAILLDIQMGNANGLDAIRPIRALSRNTQILMFTSMSDSDSKKRALANGASGFLLKSAPVDKIVAAIRQAMEAPAPHLKRLVHTPRRPAAEVSKPHSWIEPWLRLIAPRRGQAISAGR
jgi:DNA-binding NarL/FixJ family response regulator